MKKNLAIIPARGGSKGVPRKNIRLLDGKPLIYYTINSALKSGVIDKLIVSTDDDEIASIARSLGAEVINRPKEIAGDSIPTEPVMIHVIDMLNKQGYYPDNVALIQCTSPLLSSEVISQCVSSLNNSKFDSCITVFKPGGYEFKWTKKENSTFIPEHDINNRLCRQDINMPYHENGAFYITSVDLFKKTKNRFGGSLAKITAVEMTEDDSLQIDTEYHFWLAEKLIQKYKNN
jgi:CMP-N-acetylneuraminic acid synthetase